MESTIQHILIFLPLSLSLPPSPLPPLSLLFYCNYSIPQESLTNMMKM
jgi:hypothetical protein